MRAVEPSRSGMFIHTGWMRKESAGFVKPMGLMLHFYVMCGEIFHASIVDRYRDIVKGTKGPVPFGHHRSLGSKAIENDSPPTPGSSRREEAEIEVTVGTTQQSR